MNEFSYDYYRNLIKKIRLKNIPIIDFSDVDMYNTWCIIRHDVEFSIDRAHKLAMIENKIGVKSTYNIQLSNNNYNSLSIKNLQLIKDIISMGHKIGVHTYMKKDFLYGNTEHQMKVHILKEISILSYYLDYKIDRFVYHRPRYEWIVKPFHIDNNIINQYDEKFIDHDFENTGVMKITYLSDSNHRWKYANDVNGEKIHLLCHPYSWTDTGYDNLNNFKWLIKEKNREIIKSLENEITSFPDELKE